MFPVRLRGAHNAGRNDKKPNDAATQGRESSHGALLPPPLYASVENLSIQLALIEQRRRSAPRRRRGHRGKGFKSNANPALHSLRCGGENYHPAQLLSEVTCCSQKSSVTPHSSKLTDSGARDMGSRQQRLRRADHEPRRCRLQPLCRRRHSRRGRQSHRRRATPVHQC